jgi:hypothetical protein
MNEEWNKFRHSNIIGQTFTDMCIFIISFSVWSECSSEYLNMLEIVFCMTYWQMLSLYLSVNMNDSCQLLEQESYDLILFDSDFGKKWEPLGRYPFWIPYQTDTNNRYIPTLSRYHTVTYTYTPLYQTDTDTYIYLRIYIKPIPIPIWFHISRYQYLLV